MSGIFDKEPPVLSVETILRLRKLAEWKEKGKLLLEVNTNLRPVRNNDPAWVIAAIPAIVQTVVAIRRQVAREQAMEAKYEEVNRDVLRIAYGQESRMTPFGVVTKPLIDWVD